MTDSPIIPGSHSKPLGPDGGWRSEWYRFLRDLARQRSLSGDQSAAISSLAERVTTLEQAEVEQGIAAILGPFSVKAYTDSDGNVRVQLDGDTPAPAASHYYGTDESGVRGYHELPSGGVPYFVPEGSTFRVREYIQALFSMPIDCEGYLDVEGYLVEVD